jgi:hypothetical protein
MLRLPRELSGKHMKSSSRSTVLQHSWPPAKVLDTLGVALWTFAIATAAGPAVADDAPNRIQIDYAVPKSKDHVNLADRLRANRALEKMQEMFGSFRLPNDLTLSTKECGMANAWYQRPTVTICYEYVDDIEKGIRKDTHDGITPNDAAVGQFIYVVAHEMGHALFDTLNF